MSYFNISKFLPHNILNSNCYKFLQFYFLNLNYYEFLQLNILNFVILHVLINDKLNCIVEILHNYIKLFIGIYGNYLDYYHNKNEYSYYLIQICMFIIQNNLLLFYISYILICAYLSNNKTTKIKLLIKLHLLLFINNYYDYDINYLLIFFISFICTFLYFVNEKTTKIELLKKIHFLLLFIISVKKINNMINKFGQILCSLYCLINSYYSFNFSSNFLLTNDCNIAFVNILYIFKVLYEFIIFMIIMFFI